MLKKKVGRLSAKQVAVFHQHSGYFHLRKMGDLTFAIHSMNSGGQTFTCTRNEHNIMAKLSLQLFLQL